MLTLKNGTRFWASVESNVLPCLALGVAKGKSVLTKVMKRVAASDISPMTQRMGTAAGLAAACSFSEQHSPHQLIYHTSLKDKFKVRGDFWHDFR